MTEPKLLTERELLGLLEWNTPKQILDELRERGLIAEEPEPEPLVEVELAAFLEKAVFQDDRNRIPYGNGFRKGFERGMELAQPKELTREMLKEAYENTKPFSPTSAAHITRIHTALTEALK